jgi:hypothetical protein
MDQSIARVLTCMDHLLSPRARQMIDKPRKEARKEANQLQLQGLVDN